MCDALQAMPDGPEKEALLAAAMEELEQLEAEEAAAMEVLYHDGDGSDDSQTVWRQATTSRL